MTRHVVIREGAVKKNLNPPPTTPRPPPPRAQAAPRTDRREAAAYAVSRGMPFDAAFGDDDGFDAMLRAIRQGNLDAQLTRRQRLARWLRRFFGRR